MNVTTKQQFHLIRMFVIDNQAEDLQILKWCFLLH